MTGIVRRAGAGWKRDYWGIKKWMFERDYSIGQICRDLGMAPTEGSRTIAGRANNRKVLRRLLELGCSPEMLDLPMDMRGPADA